MGSKSAGQQTTVQRLDPATEAFRNEVFRQAKGAVGYDVGPNAPALQATPGVSPLTDQAAGLFGNAVTAGNLGLNALGGDPSAIGTLMNPYQANVIDQLKSQYGDLAANTTNAVNDAFTRSGAFGGSRQGVAQGVALGQLNKDLGQQIAGLQYQGYNNAIGQAGQLANLGLGGAGALQGLGEYQRQVALQQDPQMRRLQILQGLLGAPSGMTQSTPLERNPFSSALGGAATGFSFGGPIGAGVGGLIGLLGG